MALANMGFKKTKVGLIWGEENKPYGEKETRRGRRRRRRRRREEEEPRSSQQGMETNLDYAFYEILYGSYEFCMNSRKYYEFQI